MQELERMISIYHTGFVVCMVLALISFALSVFFFFKFDIRRIFDSRSGRGAKKTIQKMEEINARTGKLRQDMVAKTPLQLRPEDRITYPVTSPNLKAQAEEAVTEPLAAPAVQTAPVVSEPGEEQTTLLYTEPETTVLSAGQTTETIHKPEAKLAGLFHIEKEIMWVFTEEVI